MGQASREKAETEKRDMEVMWEPNIRTLRQHESLNNLNTFLRKAKDLEDGYRLAVQCIDPERFSKVILLIAEDNGRNGNEPGFLGIRHAEGAPRHHSHGVSGDPEKPARFIRPKYLWLEGDVLSLDELLRSGGREELKEMMSHRLTGGQHPVDRVMRGEELVMVQEDISDEELDPMCITLFRLIDMSGEVAMFPILSKMDHAGRRQELDYYGAIVAEKTEGIMDEDDWDYLREYANIVGLGLENIHLLYNLTRTINELQEEKSFKDDIILQMSHEINTPITSIKIMNDCIVGTVQHLLGSDDLPPDRNENDLMDILDSAKHIMINSARLETLSKKLYNSLLVQYGKLEIEKEEVNVAEEVDRLLLLMKHYFQKNEAEVKNHLSQRDLPSLRTDPYALFAVLEIIIENAVGYMPRDETDGTRRVPRIDIDGRVEDDWFIISVRDNGRGFEENDLKRIFKRLYRTTRIEHHKEHPGLGLPTAKDIMELLDGDIIPFSEPGKGSLFEIVLPLNG